MEVSKPLSLKKFEKGSLIRILHDGNWCPGKVEKVLPRSLIVKFDCDDKCICISEDELQAQIEYISRPPISFLSVDDGAHHCTKVKSNRSRNSTNSRDEECRRSEGSFSDVKQAQRSSMRVPLASSKKMVRFKKLINNRGKVEFIIF